MEKTAPKALIIKIIWFALLVSQGMFLALAMSSILPTPTTEPNTMLLYGLGASGLLASFGSYIFKMLSNDPKSFEDYMGKTVLSLALAESVHINGIVHLVMGGDQSWYFSYAITGLLLHFYYFPKDAAEKLAKFDKAVS